MDNSTAIARVEHLAKIYAAQALKPLTAARPATPEDAPNAKALQLTADLARIGAEEIAKVPLGWKANMIAGYHELAFRLVERGIDFSHHASENPAPVAAIAEIDRLRAEVGDLKGAMRDLIPYAQATIGLPRQSWPTDSVILRAERLIETKVINLKG